MAIVYGIYLTKIDHIIHMTDVTLFSFLLTGQFWAANFLALLAALIYSMASTGATEGNLKWQLPMTNWAYRLRFTGVFVLTAVITNASVTGVLAAISSL